MELDARLKPLREQQEAIRRNIKKTAEVKNIFEISDKKIQDVVENLTDELKNAASKPSRGLQELSLMKS